MLVTRNHIKLTLEGARTILEGAFARARAISVPMDVAVVDDGGTLLAFSRMDGAKLTSVEIAINKAFTAACTRKGTHEYAPVAGAGGPAFGIHASHGGRFTIFGGGLPVVIDGQTIGGVGCSSGSPEQDREVAQAGIDALVAALARERIT
ncbi:MAG TPA: heme-binding protein [Polyangia bacterium]|nr:heme-binding protein [Polyangia bacterium]